MKKISVLILGALLSLGALTGCYNTGDNDTAIVGAYGTLDICLEDNTYKEAPRYEELDYTYFANTYDDFILTIHASFRGSRVAHFAGDVATFEKNSFCEPTYLKDSDEGPTYLLHFLKEGHCCLRMSVGERWAHTINFKIENGNSVWKDN